MRFWSRAPAFGPFQTPRVLLVRAEHWGLLPEPRTYQKTNVPLKSCPESQGRTSAEHRLCASSLQRGDLLYSQSMAAQLTHPEEQAVE